MDTSFRWKAESAIIPPDIMIERNGQIVTRITKGGVVIWPTDLHTAAMQQAKALQQEQLLSDAGVPGYGISPKSANDMQVGGYHYRTKDASGTCPTCKTPIQHWDWAHNLRGLEYAATKYISRWRDKGGLESLKKAIHYLQKLIEIHFPDVIVVIDYRNRVEGTLRRDELQYIERAGEFNKGNGETTASQGLAGSSAIHQTAVDFDKKGNC